MSSGRGAFLLLALAVGWGGAKLFDIGDIYVSSGYHYLVLGLLAVGLYGSTRDIDLAALRGNLRIVLLAVSVGVLLKVALISGVLFLFYRDPMSLVLGVAVAQIDPLAVAATQRRKHMSASARAVLNAWASFDDPVTVLLTVYLSMFALQADGIGTPASAASPAATFLLNLLLNAVFAGLAFTAWLMAKAARLPERLNSGTVGARLGQVIVAVVVLGYATVGVMQSLMLGIALVGLFFRPYDQMRKSARGIVFSALLVATAALGIVLAGTAEQLTPGVVGKGVLLGSAAFGAQMLTGWLLSLRRDRIERLNLVLSQQNGLTAIVLALVLEPDFTGAVAVIAVAIVVTNVLYGLGGRYLRKAEAEELDEPTESDAVKQRDEASGTSREVMAAKARQARSAAPGHRVADTASGIRRHVPGPSRH